MAELPLIINQAVGTAWTIASSISKLISTCRDAPASITLADRQCVAVRGQLAMLQSLMLDETWSQRAERSRIDFSYFVGTIIDCAETLMELEECLNKINGGIDTHNSGSRAPRVGPQQMLRYQWVKHDLERLGALLQVSRDSIGPILGVLQIEQNNRMEDSLMRLQQQVSEFRRSNSLKWKAMRVDIGSMSRTLAVPESSDSSHLPPIPSAPAGIPHVYSNYSNGQSDVTIADVNPCDAIVSGPVEHIDPNEVTNRVANDLPRRALSIRSSSAAPGIDLKRSLSAAKSAQAQLEGRLASYEDLLKEKDARIKDLHQAAEQLAESKRSMELQLAGECERMQSEHARSVTDLEGQIKSLENSLQGRDAELLELRFSLSGYHSHISRSEEQRVHLQQDIAGLHEQLNVKAVEKAALESQLALSKDESQKLAAHVKALQDQSAAASVENANLSRDLAAAKAAVAQLQTHIAAQRTKKESLRKQLEAAALSARTHASKADSLQKELSAATQETQLAQQRLQEKVVEWSGTLEALKEAQNEAAVARKRIMRLEEELAMERDEVGRAWQDVAEARNRVAGLEKKQREMAARVARLEADNERLTIESTATEVELADANRKLRDEQATIAMLATDNADLELRLHAQGVVATEAAAVSASEVTKPVTKKKDEKKAERKKEEEKKEKKEEEETKTDSGAAVPGTVVVAGTAVALFLAAGAWNLRGIQS